MMSTALPLSPVHLRWEEYRRNLRWEAAAGKEWGFERGIYPACESPGLSAHVMVVPFGQAWTPEVAQTDLFIVGAQGEIEFYIDSDIFRLQENDILRLREGVEYSYHNTGPDLALVYFVAEDKSLSQTKGLTWSDQRVVHLNWQESQRGFEWHSPLAERMGSHRYSGPFVETSRLMGHITRMPPGQASPWHGVPTDAIFLQLAGEIEFKFAGAIWPMKSLDILMIPANIPYVYQNVSLSYEHFFIALAKPPEGAKNIYYENDPGWPVSDSASVLYHRGPGWPVPGADREDPPSSSGSPIEAL
jgi:quercetin dioxygenase-like cupin family protein